jgi:hypothetical protein
MSEDQELRRTQRRSDLRCVAGMIYPREDGESRALSSCSKALDRLLDRELTL